MKLKNKTTQEIWSIPEWRTPAVQEGDISFFAELNGDGKLFSYKSLDELNKEWEDYTPVEPLIKDKKVRKAIREWAVYNGVREVFYFTDGEGGSRLDAHTVTMGFYNELRELKEWEKYTIAELCGKEKK